MASPHLDIRKLKDEVAEYLRKQKHDKAAEVLEQLVRAEPKDMQHRLKLGDTYRRLHIEEKAVTCYQIAAKHFSDEGQLIKAIGAVKVLLEIDPKNELAQRELADMNNRRMGKPTLEAAGLRAPKAIGSGARATSALELAEGEKVAADISSMLEGSHRGHAPAPSDDEPLELDEAPKAIRAGIKAPIAPVYTPPKVAQRGVVSARAIAPPPMQRGSFDLSAEEESLDLDTSDHSMEGLIERDGPSVRKAPEPARPAPKPQTPQVRARPTAPPAVSIDLEPELAEAELDEVLELPDDAIVEEAAPPPARRPAPALPRPAPALEEIELDLDLAPPAPAPKPEARPAQPPAQRAAPHLQGPPQPIADLLPSDAEEEIELLSISSDQELEPLPPPKPSRPLVPPAPPPAPVHAPPSALQNNDLDEAFADIGAPTTKPIVFSPPPPPPAPPAPAHKLPAKVPLFDDLSQIAFVSLVNKLDYRRWGPGELILKEGDPGRSFFVIVEGKVRVFKQRPDGSEVELAQLSEGAFFGEMALLSGAPRTANVAAVDDVELLEITDTVLRELVEQHPNVATSLKNFYRQRLLNNVMTISPMFKDFDSGERRAVVERFKMRQAAAGEVLITQGKNSDGLYVVLHGAVKVVKAVDEKDIELARLKEGDVFGEMSLLTRKPATATVTTLSNTIVLKLPRENFQELILTHPQILELVSDLTEQRKSATQAVLSGQGPGYDGMSFV